LCAVHLHESSMARCSRKHAAKLEAMFQEPPIHRDEGKIVWQGRIILPAKCTVSEPFPTNNMLLLVLSKQNQQESADFWGHDIEPR
jgi:hypothetical protein